MSEFIREETYEEKLLNEISQLKKELEEVRIEAVHYRHLVKEKNNLEELRSELRYRDGVIYGIKYAIRCNGISGAEVDR